jgi:uncharacterized protein (DUF2336 family)
MIVRQFLHWLRTAPPGERADATSALARAYLYSDLSDSDRAAAEGAMIMLLDDPSPLVRQALAAVFAESQEAPPTIVYALASDQPDVASRLLERSPLFLDTDLVDAVATGESARQVAVAGRAGLPPSVSAAIAEIGCAESCLVVLENPDAELAPFSLDRIVARHGHLAVIRDVLLARDDLPAPTRQALVAKLSQTLADFVTSHEWLAGDRAQKITKEACEKATIAVAADTVSGEMGPLIRHLRDSGQLTTGLVLRALLSGNLSLFEEAMAELTGMSIARVVGIVHDRHGFGFRALYEKAGLPNSTYPIFREAIRAMQEEGFMGEAGDASRLKRRIIERVLTRCETAAIDDVDPLLTLLRRFEAEAAREEARMFCEDLVAYHAITEFAEDRQIAA